MRRRPPKPVIDEALLREGQERAEDHLSEVAGLLRRADPIDEDLRVRMVALEQAAIRAARGSPDLIMPALVAAREAMEAAAGGEGYGLRTRIQWGDEIFFRLLRRFHQPSPPSKPH
jgi:hypothetical protein